MAVGAFETMLEGRDAGVMERLFAVQIFRVHIRSERAMNAEPDKANR